MSALTKPPCGALTRLPTALDRFLIGVAAVATVAGAAGAGAFLAGDTGQTLITILGVNAPLSIFLGAAAGGGAVAWWVVSSAWHLISPPDGMRRCYNGVVNEIGRAFSSASDYLLPWTAEHDRFDVCIRSDNWDIPVLPDWQYVYCSGDAIGSPVIRSYRRNEAVVGGAIGSIAGAAVGFAGGLLLGGFLGNLAFLACLGLGPFSFLCLLLALLLAFLLSAITTTAAAILGGNLGRLYAMNFEGPQTQTLAYGYLVLGQYVTVTGNIIQFGTDNGAYVAYLINHLSLHGRSLTPIPADLQPHFSHDDPDANLEDFCSLPPHTR